MSDATVALDQLEAAVRRALDTGDTSDLDVVDYGEISTVLRIDTEDGTLACKRLPPIPVDAIGAYGHVFRAYLDALAGRGVDVVESTLYSVVGDDGETTVYCVQPIQERLLVDRLRTATLDDAADLAATVVDHVLAGVGPDIGLDAQVSNWAVTEAGGLTYFDVTTPLLRDNSGNEMLDTDLFLASLPWVLHAAVRWFLLDEILSHYYDPRAALVDLIANLQKERLEDLTGTFLGAANHRVETPITEDEVVKYYRFDAAMWEVLQRLRRGDRWWQRTIRRRRYPFLLPGKVGR
jgi:hypothetical protein